MDMDTTTEPVSAESRIEALLAVHPKGFDLSLDRLRLLLKKLGNPQNEIPPVIHVAGTNGKGSTVAFCRAILETAGLAVHVDTSPHLVRWHERFRIGKKETPGQLVDDTVLSDAIARATDANGDRPITVYELLTAAMFLLFSEQPADVCLIEVGLGGRFDSTNVVENVAVSVITPVAMDHQNFLGDTLAKIAFEKAGIIRDHTPLIVGPQEDEALAVIERQAARHRAPLSVAGEHFQSVLQDGRLLFQDNGSLLDLTPPRLPGAHQIANAGTAIAVCRQFAQVSGLQLGEDAIERGLATAHWPGRLQRIKQGELLELLPSDTEVWLDGGHNPHAATAIANHFATLNERCSRPLILVCGMLNTKDPTGYFQQFSGLVQHAFTVPLQSSDAAVEPRALAATCDAAGIVATPCSSLRSALLEAGSFGPQARILIGGSLYLAGDFLAENGTFPD